MTHRFTGHDPAEGHDSGGLPWEGRARGTPPPAPCR